MFLFAHLKFKVPILNSKTSIITIWDITLIFIRMNILAYLNQSIENTEVAFVQGANERNEIFEKINKQ